MKFIKICWKCRRFQNFIYKSSIFAEIFIKFTKFLIFSENVDFFGTLPCQQTGHLINSSMSASAFSAIFHRFFSLAENFWRKNWDFFLIKNSIFTEKLNFLLFNFYLFWWRNWDLIFSQWEDSVSHNFIVFIYFLFFYNFLKNLGENYFSSEFYFLSMKKIKKNVNFEKNHKKNRIFLPNVCLEKIVKNIIFFRFSKKKSFDFRYFRRKSDFQFSGNIPIG